MKQLFTNILFFVACTVILTARAQNDTINPLWSTTGPAILSNGAMQWDNILEWNHMNASGSSGITQYNSINGNSVLRLGIGSKSELTLGLTGGNTTYHYDNGINNGYDTTMGSLSPQVGMRMSLYDGKGWLPQITFNTHISYNTYFGGDSFVQPSLGLEFRNRIGKRWAIDYSIGYVWSKLNYGSVGSYITGSIFARWLVTDKLMIGLGMNDYKAQMSILYQASDCLQLSLQGNIEGISGPVVSKDWYAHDLMLGISWRIK